MGTGVDRKRPLVAAAVAGGLLIAGLIAHNATEDSTSAGHSTRASTTSFAPTTLSAGQDAAPPSWSPTLDSPSATEVDPQASSALAELASLPVKGRAPKTGYDRDLFGDAWTDDVTVAGGHNGCDTRNDILRRDLVAVEIKPGSNGCAVLSGTLNDPYTGTTIAFQRGEATSSQVQIDHLVALSDAWQKGAQQWDEAKRRDFANDPINLQATTGSINQQKGDGDAATWLPPNKSYRCTYVARIVEVKSAYGLWVTQAEHDAIARILSNCDTDLFVPGPADVPDTTPVDQPSTAPTQDVSVPTPPPTQVGSSAYYASCKDAKAAGAAPLYRGQPGYRSGLDGDDDGVACER